MLDLNNIEGLPYQEPVRPKLSKIRNFGLPKTKQVWTRHEEYLEFDWTEGWENKASPEQIEYLDEEIGRLYEGEWIFIEGKPVYINNYCYFFLQWMYLENEYYPEFRDSSLYYFRFVEIAEKIKLCWGHVLIKGRRLGASSMEASIELLQGLIYRNSRQGIISKTGDDAKDIFEFIVIANQALPSFLKPSLEGGESPKKVLSFKKQAGRITKEKTQAGNREGLNNTIGWKATALNSWDSGKLLRILIDEAAKWEIDVNTYLKIVGKTLTKGAAVTGKAAVVSTVNRGDKGGDRFKIIWDQSDQSKTNRLGQTTSKLIRIFISAIYGYEGYIDRYGNSVTEKPTPEQEAWLRNDPRCPDPTIGSREYIQMQRDLLANDEEGLQEEIRQAPFTWKEVFESAGKAIHFDKKSHEAQLERIKTKLEEAGRDTEKGELGRRGWFREKLDGSTFWEDNEKGLWYIQQFPETPNLFEKNSTQGKTKYKPMNTSYGGAGLDPIAHADATVEKGSDAALVIRRRPTQIDLDNSGMPVAMLLGRMSTKSEFHKQVYYGLKHYGIRMLGERMPSDWIDWARENGYLDYLIGTVRSDKTEVKGAAPQNKDYIEEHLSVMVESSYNDVEKIWYRRLIQDRLDFDINDRTDYDGAIADGNALIACKEPIKTLKKVASGLQYVRQGKICTYE